MVVTSRLVPIPAPAPAGSREVRYMYKWKAFHPGQFRPGVKEEGAPVYGNDAQGWVDNGVGWYLAGYIEDQSGALRPQNREELTQCIGCHSGIVATEFPQFTSGTGKHRGLHLGVAAQVPRRTGMAEMDYLSYLAQSGRRRIRRPHRPIGRSVGTED